MDTGLVQPILVNKTGYHEDLVLAIAKSSVLTYSQTIDDPVWREWFSGKFTKSVRRTKKDLTVLQKTLGGSIVKIGEAVALGMLPTTYINMPKIVRDGQVAGIELPRRGGWWEEKNGLHLMLNKDLEMSTGKTGAQIAHGVMAWFLRANPKEREEWLLLNCPVSIQELNSQEINNLASPIEIHDAGLTEIIAGSLTVKVLGPHAMDKDLLT